jgi:hypothetical protein
MDIAGDGDIAAEDGACAYQINYGAETSRLNKAMVG